MQGQGPGKSLGSDWTGRAAQGQVQSLLWLKWALLPLCWGQPLLAPCLPSLVFLVHQTGTPWPPPEDFPRGDQSKALKPPTSQITCPRSQGLRPASL